MKIAFYVQRVASAPGFRNNISAHVQLPVKTMLLLRERGHEVELITTEFGADLELPEIIDKSFTVRQVPYGTKQGGQLVMYSGRIPGIRPIHLFKQIYALRRLCRTQRYDIIHLSGGLGVAKLACALKMLGIRTPFVMSMSHSPARLSWINRRILRKMDALLAATEYVAKGCRGQGFQASTIKHGIIKSTVLLRKSEESVAWRDRSRVIFWRDPDRENGADIALSVFERLAPEFSSIQFTIATRPHWDPVEGLLEASKRFRNIEYLNFPYAEGITIEALLEESLCAVLPFRNLSTNPQLAVLESMAAGCVVITTSIESNPEMIDSGKDGFLVPRGNCDGIERIIRDILRAPANFYEISQNARGRMADQTDWNLYGEMVESLYMQVAARSSI
jgi:glycosyltransferase involved in cell wall biosynthesis